MSSYDHWAPGYWMNETSGVLKPAIIAYLNRKPLSEAEIAAIRAYLRQWIMADGWAPTPRLQTLRKSLDGLTSAKAISAWLDKAIIEGLDPL